MYRRYMVFDWDYCDNTGPFDCVEASFDSKEEAERFSSLLNDRCCANSCVFDRIEGKVIKKFKGDDNA